MLILFRLYNGKAAEQELKSLQDQATSSFTFGKDLIKHNLVVFRNGEGALQVECKNSKKNLIVETIFVDSASTGGCDFRGKTQSCHLLSETR